MAESETNTTTYILTLLGLILPLILIPATMVFWRPSQPKFPVQGRTVLLTGGSQGLGLSVAKKLASKGANIVIVARDETKLAAALKEIQASAADPSTQRFLFLSHDLTDPSSATTILKQVTEWNNDQPPDIVWNCAGQCTPAFFADASISTHREQMDTLYWTATYMAHAVLNLWKAPSPSSTTTTTQHDPNSRPAPPPLTRHLIFTCSTLPMFPVAGYAPYTPAKAAMRALTDTLQHEVALYNGAHSSTTLPASQKPPAPIAISTIYPMGILSPNFAREEALKPAITKMLEESDKPQDPDEVAEQAIRGLERGERLITTNMLGRLMVGAGMGGSLRGGVGDVLWNFLGSVVVVFVGWDFWNKAQKWGRQKGLDTGPENGQRK